MENVAGVGDDDDFGDLYADVEVQASSAINAIAIHSSSVEHDAAGNSNNENVVQECESESEDDLNIVLNDDENDDCEDENEENGGFSGEGNGLGQNSNGSENGNGEKNSYKYTRPPQAAYSSHLKANGSSCAPSYSTASVKGNWEDNSYMQRVGSGFAAQNGQSFSLPRSRNILDVNIDMFEKKPWRYPGVDLTDYFNFGFDEESWKHYCNCLDEHREQTKKLVKDSNYKTSRKSKPKGREIEVEESMIERQPSTDVGRPQDRDSGVIIQIALQQSMEDPISSTKEQQEASENGDVGGDRKEFLCFSSASEDELASLEGTGEGSGNSTSGRHNTPVREHVSMDSDNEGGNSEFSDADEHHHQEGTYCNVDQTSGAIKSSHDANKSSERDISDPRKPMKLHAPMHGGAREHSPGSSSCSPSHGSTFGDGTFLDLEKSYDHHARFLSNAESKLREKGAFDYQPISRTKHVRTKSGDPKYFARGRRSVQRDLLHDRRRPGRMSETISAHLKDEDSCKSDARILYERRNSTVIQHRQKDGRYAFHSHEREDTSHFKRAEPFDSNAGQFSDYPCRDSYKKNPEIECQLKCRYDKSWSGDGRVKTKLDLLELSMYTDDELLEIERPHFGRKLTVQDMDNVSFHESKKWIDKYIPYLDDEKSSQRMWKIDQLQSNKRVRTDDLVTECNYIYDVMETTDNRYRPYRSRDTNTLEDGYHVNSTYSRREIKSPSRGKRSHNYSLCESSNDICCVDLKDEEERFDGYRSQSFRLFRESCTASRRWQNPELPHGRHRIISGTRICDGQFANLANSIGANQAIKYPGNHDNFRRRGTLQSERMQWVEDEDSSRCQQNILDAERTSYSFRRTSTDRKFQSFDNKHGTNLVEKLLDDRHVDQEKYKLIREGNVASQFGQGPKVFHKDNHWRRFPRGRDSVDTGLVVENREDVNWAVNKKKEIATPLKLLSYAYSFYLCLRQDPVVGSILTLALMASTTTNPVYFYKVGSGEGRVYAIHTTTLESSRRCSKAGGVTYFDRYGYLDSDSYVELKSIDGTSKPHFRKTLRTRYVTTDPKEKDKERLDIFSGSEQEESLDIEEGQIISEETNEKIIKKRSTCSGKSKISEMKKFANNKNAEGQDNRRILEIMAKMEKRGERFNQPIALKSDPKYVSKPLVDSFAVLTETMQPRPARKRRWAASEAI